MLASAGQEAQPLETHCGAHVQGAGGGGQLGSEGRVGMWLFSALRCSAAQWQHAQQMAAVCCACAAHLHALPGGGVQEKGEVRVGAAHRHAPLAGVGRAAEVAVGGALQGGPGEGAQEGGGLMAESWRGSGTAQRAQLPLHSAAF